MAMTLLALPSCKSLDPAIVASATSSASATIHTHDTVIVRDSIFIREIQQGDTVYLTRIEFRDRWRTQLVHDTIVHTDSIVQVIEHPPEKYIPPFYKYCTTILWIILAAGIVYIVCKTYIKFRL
jgi:hypothetical protein